MRRPGDERFATVTARRPVMEQVLGGVAEREPALEVRRGTTVASLIVEPEPGLPHVSGVRLDTGETITADLVVDAMGRRSRLPRWLDDAGVAPIEEETEDSGFIYYGRYFRSADGSTPPLYTPPLCPLGSFSILSLPADNGTWAVGFVTATGDKPLKELRHLDRWEAVLRACPAHAHLLEGEPISEMLAMGGLVDRYRRLAPRRAAGDHGRGAPGRRVLVHQPVTGTRHLAGADARPLPARHGRVDGRRPPRVRGGVGSRNRDQTHALVPRHAG